MKTRNGQPPTTINRAKPFSSNPAPGKDTSAACNKITGIRNTTVKRPIKKKFLIVTQQLKNCLAELLFNNKKAPNASLYGFRNIGNTCYANAALNLLISSMGADALLESLKKTLAEETDVKKSAVTKQFISLIKKSQTSEIPLEQELTEFYTGLQDLDVFKEKIKKAGKETNAYKFTIIGEQNDAHEFLLKLIELFKLNDIPSHSATLKETLVNHSDSSKTRDKFRGNPAFIQEVPVTDAGITLQGIIDTTCQSELVNVRWDENDTENTTVTNKKEWVLNTDIAGFKVFTLKINTANSRGGISKLRLKNLDLTAQVTLPVTDKDGKKWLVTLESGGIIIYRGGIKSGHYYMYSNAGNKGWFKHDDASVTAVKKPGNRDQPKIISFRVIDIQEQK